MSKHFIKATIVLLFALVSNINAAPPPTLTDAAVTQLAEEALKKQGDDPNAYKVHAGPVYLPSSKQGNQIPNVWMIWYEGEPNEQQVVNGFAVFVDDSTRLVRVSPSTRVLPKTDALALQSVIRKIKGAIPK